MGFVAVLDGCSPNGKSKNDRIVGSQQDVMLP